MLKQVQGAALVEEQETVVNIDHKAKAADVYSSKPSMIKTLKRLLQNHPEETKLLHEDRYGINITVPISWIKIRPVKKRTAEWTAEAAERLKQARSKRIKEPNI